MELQQALANLHHAQIKKKKKQKRTNLIALPIGFALGILISMSENLFFKELEGATLLLMLALLCTLPLQLILHELGHLVFGLASNYRFVSFRVFSSAFYKKDGKLRFGRYRVPGTMGQCLMCPVQEDDTTPYRALFLGGVLVNAVTGLLSVIPLIFCYHILFVRFLFIGMIFWGITLALINGIPYKNGAVANDGYHAKILKNSDARRVLFNQLRISAAMTEGICLCDMPKEWFIPPQNDSNDPLCVSLRMMEAEQEMECSRFDAAETILLDLAVHGENLTEFQLSAILADLLYLEMLKGHRHDVIELLHRELNRYFMLTRNAFATLRIDITYHYLFTGNLDKVKRLEKKFEKLTKRFPFTGEVARERSLIAHPKALYEGWRDSSHS